VTFNGQTKHQRKILLGWELLGDERNEEGEAFIVWRKFTASLNEKSSLRPFLKAWRGREFTHDELESFSMANLVGAPCLLGVAHNVSEKDGNTYANVTSAVKLPKGMSVPKPSHECFVFDIDKWDQKRFDSFRSDKMKQAILASPEAQAALGKGAVAKVPAPGVDEREPGDEDRDVPY
jgi:hypothetical protein